MTTRKYSSRSQQTTLTGAITSGATSMTVVSGTALLGGVTIPSGTTFTLVIDVDTALEEIVDATAVSTNTFTITRAIDGSSAQDHSAGAVVRHMAIGRDYRDANLHTQADASYNDGSGNAQSMHGIAAGEGVVVGTLKTQTLTNKTLTSPTITNPSISGAGVDASIVFEGATADAHETTLTVVDPTQDNTITLPNTTGTVVLDSATQTLTNKTLTSPTISGSPVITGLSSAGMVASSATPKDYVDSILGSATAAATSAASAATSAASAATSATSAAASATTSANSSIASATSASAAATSATSAAASATAAATSAASAATQATFASTSATSSATSANAAATSASSAAASATTASNSAATAITQATNAGISATAAATSATSAAASATAAATSATSAAASASSAAVSAASAAAAVTSAIQATIIDAKGDLIVGSAADTAARLAVGTDGYLLTASSTAANGVTWAAAPVSLPSQTGNDGKVLVTNGTTASWSGAAPVAQTAEPTTLIDGLVWVDTDGTAPTTVITRWSKSGLASGTTLLSGNDDDSKPLSYTPGYEQVFVNGVLLSRKGVDYTATSGTSITLATGLTTGDIVEVICASQVAATDTYTQGQANSIFYQTATTPIAGKNKIINGDFSINQRGFSSSTTNNTFNFDRWTQQNSGGTTTVSSQTFTTGSAPVSGYEAKNFLQVVTASQSAAGDYAAIEQRIEGVRTFAGQTITISFWAKAASGTPNVGVSIGQDFGVSGSTGVIISASVQPITTSWARYSFNINVPSISGKTIGTANDMLKFDIWTSAGTTISGAGYPAVGVQNATIGIWGVQIEAGSVATAFQTATGTIQGELAACQRYYQRKAAATNFYRYAIGTNISSTQAGYIISFEVQMRTTPSFAASGSFDNVEGTTSKGIVAPTLSSDGNSPDSCFLNSAITSATTGYSIQLRSYSNTTSYLEFSAEL